MSETAAYIPTVREFPLGSVKLTDGYCANALEKEAKYLLSFDNARVLAGFRLNAGLKTEAEPYGGWERHLIGGHAMGHYFSALSQAAVNPGLEKSRREEIEKKLREIISGLKECQLENGFLWAGRISDPDNVEIQFDLVEQGRGNEDIIKVAWVPWYTMHKILAGLIAAYSVAGVSEALEIAKKLGDWVCSRTESWDQKTRETVLDTEYGGMNDVMYQLYSVTGCDRYAEAAHAFDEEKLFGDILTNRHNLLTGRHANTTIPKIIGFLMRYQICHGKTINAKHPYKVEASGYLKVAEIFWENVMEHHTYHTGGNSEWEHFREDDSLDKNRTNANCETCNVYNMLKLTKGLFEATGEKKYADYLEEAFLNHILASQNPKTGMTTYFQSMATGYFKVFSSPWDDFWCCTGSGMENFTKLGDSMFFGSENEVYIVEYLSSRLEANGVLLTMNEDIAKSGEVKISIESPDQLNFSLRIPDWSDKFEVLVNGKKTEFAERNGFAKISVKRGDSVVLKLSPKLGVLSLKDSENVFALKFGPWLLAAKLGRENMTETRTGVHVAIPEKSVSDGKLKLDCAKKQLESAPEKYVRRIGDAEFELGGLRFVPYYLVEERYGIYWEAE